MVAALAVSILAAGMAQAQYKQDAPKTNQPTTQQGAPAVQLTPVAATQPDASDAARRITRDEAIKMVKEGKAVYIDVRSKEQYDLNHIPGAISIPLAELPNRWKDLPAGKFLVTYCA